MNKSEKQ